MWERRSSGQGGHRITSLARFEEVATGHCSDDAERPRNSAVVNSSDE
jgi:hypothetical protein